MCLTRIFNDYCNCLFIGLIMLLLAVALYFGKDYNVIDKKLDENLFIVFTCMGSMCVLSYLFSCLCNKKKYKKIRRHSSFDNYDSLV